MFPVSYYPHTSVVFPLHEWQRVLALHVTMFDPRLSC